MTTEPEPDPDSNRADPEPAVATGAIGSDGWWQLVARLGVDRRSVEHTLAVATGDGDLAAIDPHDLEPAGSPAEHAVSYLLLFRDVPTYASLMYVVHTWDDASDPLREWIVGHYAACIDGEDDRHREAALYSLWVDYFEVPERAAFVFPRLVASVARRGDLLASSGPVPWPAKRAVYRDAARDERLHAALAAGLVRSFYDLYGSVEPVEARALVQAIRIEDPVIRAALERVLTEPARWRVVAVVAVDETDERWRRWLPSPSHGPSFLLLLDPLDGPRPWVPDAELVHDGRLVGRLVHLDFPFDPAIAHQREGASDGEAAVLFRVEGDRSAARCALEHEVVSWPAGLAPIGTRRSVIDDGLIQRWIAELLAHDDPRFEWVKPAVRALDFLPLYLGWGSVVGIRPDGSLVEWDHKNDRDALKRLSDPYWERMALCQGAKSYPELAALIPPRPSAAADCGSCNATGQLEHAPHILCQCGGLGWIVPGEQHAPFPG